MDTVHWRDRMMKERELALILQPLNTVERLQKIRRIHCVAIAKEHIRPAIAIEIDELDSAGAVTGMRGGINGFLAKLASAPIEKGDDGFVFLTQKRDEV